MDFTSQLQKLLAKEFQSCLAVDREERAAAKRENRKPQPVANASVFNMQVQIAT